jgi:hypothetical protein
MLQPVAGVEKVSRAEEMGQVFSCAGRMAASGRLQARCLLEKEMPRKARLWAQNIRWYMMQQMAAKSPN